MAPQNDFFFYLLQFLLLPLEEPLDQKKSANWWKKVFDGPKYIFFNHPNPTILLAGFTGAEKHLEIDQQMNKNASSCCGSATDAVSHFQSSKVRGFDIFFTIVVTS